MRNRRMAVAAVGITILFAGCGGSDEGTQATSSPTPATTGDAGETSSEATTTSEATTESTPRLEGTWRTGPISQGDIEATLRRYGLEKWIKPFRPLTPLAETTTLILDLHEGEWDLYGKSGGGPRQEIDYDAEYVVKGDRVEKIHATGVTTYRWSVTGDTLTFEWLKSTEPPYQGVPDEVFSRVLYETKEFRRQD